MDAAGEQAILGGASALRRFARQAREAKRTPAAPTMERCDLCGAPIAAEHRHLLEVGTRQVLCACRACAILFDRDAASAGRCKLIPERRLWLADFQMDDANWARLGIPVRMASVLRSTPAGGPLALYPGPMGATEAPVDADAWTELAARNPVLATMAPDVEALLVNRTHGASLHLLVPVDECFRLTAIIRARWKGLGGGQEMWAAVDAFFEELRARSQGSGGSASSA